MYGKNPFGEPDGERCDITDLMKEYIEADYGKFSSKIGTETVKNIRIVVGARGSGKTVYLKRYAAFLRDNTNCYVYSSDTELPETRLIVRFCEMCERRLLSERWTSVWKCALTRSLLSHILCVDVLSSKISETEKNELRHYGGRPENGGLFPEIVCDMSVYSELKSILSNYATPNEIESYVNNTEWEKLDNLLGKLLQKLPPIYFFIDGADDSFPRAPMHWLRCQKGLFYRALKTATSSHYSKRFNVVVSVRDQVYSNVVEGEHRTKYMDSKNIIILDWSYLSIKHFLNEKINRLDECYFIGDAGEKTIENWLAVSSITNLQRKIEEPLVDYILRHTRLTPRDIIQIGNQLASIKSEIDIGSEDRSQSICWLIREKVNSRAYTFGEELLESCSNQILNHLTGGKYYSSSEEFKPRFKDTYARVLKQLDKDCFSWGDINNIKSTIQYDEEVICTMTLFDVLWQSGGIGYLEHSKNGIDTENFFVDNNYQDFKLPPEKNRYVFSSCVKDYLNIKNNFAPPIAGAHRN